MSGHGAEPTPAPGTSDRDPPPIVDWAIIGRRLRATAIALLGLAVLAWLVVGVTGDGVRVVDLWGYVGLAFAGMFVAELVVVGGSAFRGLLRAGERGERLAGPDVGLLPTSVVRRSQRGQDRP